MGRRVRPDASEVDGGGLRSAAAEPSLTRAPLPRPLQQGKGSKCHRFGGLAVVIGAIGSAVTNQLGGRADFADVVSFGRRPRPPLDLTEEASIAAAALPADGRPVRLVFDATGVLHDSDGLNP